jgi:hypothetical protein
MIAFTSPITIPVPVLNHGEHWAGLVTTERGVHHVILLPGDSAEATWKKQRVWATWAKSIGGDLPDRIELAMLRRTLPEEFRSQTRRST